MAIIEEDETLLAFTEEALEHLDGIEADLLSIEENGADIDSDVVNKVFRAVHSIKGGAGFLGLDKVKDLSHNAENILNMVRNEELVPTPAIVSVLLAATDLLTAMISDVTTSNDVDITTHVNNLKDILEDSVEEEDKPSLEAFIHIGTSVQPELFTVNKFEHETALKQGKNIFIIEYDLIADIEEKGKTPLEIIGELQQTGELFDSFVDIASVGGLDSKESTLRIPLYILYGTIMEVELLTGFLELPDEQITPPVIQEESGSATAPKAPQPPAEPVISETPEPSLQEFPKAPPAPSLETPQKPTKAPQKKKILPPAKAFKAESNLRVNVKILDNLMTLAGELVLTRNQLVQAVSSRNQQGVDTVSQRLDLVTSELQEAIMSTRMQPVGNVFNKFKRVVRDLTRDLGKNINLIIEGEDVDLDKTIIEAIGDPLTHLVRNSIDHGIETPDERVTKGKDATGTLRLSAFHEGGQVIIEIQDDGAGINTERLKQKSLKMGTHDASELEAMSKKELAKLIFTPGLSTAEALSDISGRGVGMDVVFTNLSKLGGVIDVNTETDLGTTITIKLPLTLAIIPSLIIQAQGERYAIPQVNLVELVRVPANQIKNRIEKIGSALVMRLRGELLPLIHLAEALDIKTRTFIDPVTGESKPDQRHAIVDRRTLNSADEEFNPEDFKRNEGSDRRRAPLSAYNILVLSSGDYNYGLIVDRLLDSEEIVVKPLGTHLRSCHVYAGATIQGDGAVALILDVVGLSSIMNLSTISDSVKAQSNLLGDDKNSKSDSQSLLIVQNGEDEQMAIPLTLISRIERIKATDIAITGGRRNIHYRNTSLPLFGIEEVANVSYRDETKELCYVIVFTICGREVGVLMGDIIDIVESSAIIDDTTHKQPGIIGSLIIDDQITLLVDLYGIVATIMPEWAIAPQEISYDEEGDSGGGRNILIVEDSLFFLNQIKIFMEESGYIPFTAEDGLLALDVLASEHIDLIITDIEMPNMDGLELTREVRKQERFANLPIIAVTSVAGEAAEEAGMLAGINDYLIKLDREKIITQVNHYLLN